MQDAPLTGLGVALSALQAARTSLNDALLPLGRRPGAARAQPFVTLSGSPYTVVESQSSNVYDGTLTTGVSLDHKSGANMCWAVSLYWRGEECFVEPELSFSAPEDQGCQDLLTLIFPGAPE